jgi:hypothetical protein
MIDANSSIFFAHMKKIQVEQQSADDQKALARNAEMLREVKESVARREKMER